MTPELHPLKAGERERGRDDLFCKEGFSGDRTSHWQTRTVLQHVSYHIFVTFLSSVAELSGGGKKYSSKKKKVWEGRKKDSAPAQRTNVLRILKSSRFLPTHHPTRRSGDTVTADDRALCSAKKTGVGTDMRKTSCRGVKKRKKKPEDFFRLSFFLSTPSNAESRSLVIIGGAEKQKRSFMTKSQDMRKPHLCL